MKTKWVRNTLGGIVRPFQISLRYKLMLLMVLIAVLPLSLVTLFATKTTKHSLASEVIRSNESRMEWAAKYFDEKFDQLQAVSYSLLLDSTLFPNATGGAIQSEGTPSFVNQYTIDKLKSLYSANNKNIAQVALYLKSQNRLYVVDKDAGISTDQLKTPQVDWGAIGQSHESLNLLLNNGQNTFSIVRSMNRFPDREVLGGVRLEVRWKMMNSVLEMIRSESNSEVFVADADGNVMYNPYSERITTDQEMVKAALAEPDGQGYTESKRGFLFYQPSVSGQVWVVKFIPIEYVTEGASSTLNFSLITALAFAIVAIAASVLIAYITTRPIIRLTQSMKAVEIQNFEVDIREPRSDEIGTLERRFNSMLSRIKELIQTEYKATIEKRTAQVKAMQAQINPHFLHNALQAIGGIALSRNVPEINDHVRAISDLFRYTIRMKSDLVTIADELEHARNYLQIQKLRFQSMIEIRIDADEECLGCRIPKFSLQPIVENCFVHGLEGKMDAWTISIRVEKVLDEIEIDIADNGMGIDEARLAEIRRQLSQPADGQENGEGMGISNVNARIKLLFGDEYGLFISSEWNAGTTVKLLIPAQEEGEKT
ncbi:cache domain-containing sensor histidine kinase [Paenibacillus sp. JDR-2]|uniref:cache domain-containing sensor histidine kinase n=1 Tax=Paenibacillus sp. (strain JDR-2) TaxID=324057 RepID=UPI0001667A33|nr:histidine kinase [Paenibacillus sp. JDR-2]ACT02359.1 putative sensor with HAMP domain [Paenibacillus sp. JDR-2]